MTKRAYRLPIETVKSLEDVVPSQERNDVLAKLMGERLARREQDAFHQEIAKGCQEMAQACQMIGKELRALEEELGRAVEP